ncbi:hypothetical protein LCGC14_0821480 [marine sediment metagenome]|uniref:Uncharacterized protein n=1 Tax=marine sediment metagenome TaxID=412755 RepID=A0A0F9SR60_9ZZZZ
MKVRNGTIFDANEPLVTLLKMAWPVKVSYGLVKLSSKLSDQWQVIEDVRRGLVQKHGSENGNGEFGIEAGTEAYDKFKAEYDELMNQEVELVFERVALPSEADGKPILVEPLTLMFLEEFVDIE